MKKKVVIAIIIIVAILAVGGGILALSMFGPKQVPLNAPTGLQVIELADGTKKVYVDRHTGAGGYLFSIQKVGETESHPTQTPANEFNANAILTEASTYKISCQYVGQNVNYKSEKTEITYKNTISLTPPEIFLGTGDKKGKLFVNSASHYQDALDFEYTLIYALGSEIKTSTNFTTIHTNNHGLASLEFDLASVITEKGAYSICVQISVPENDYYLPALTAQLVYIVE